MEKACESVWIEMFVAGHFELYIRSFGDEFVLWRTRKMRNQRNYPVLEWPWNFFSKLQTSLHNVELYYAKTTKARRPLSIKKWLLRTFAPFQAMYEYSSCVQNSQIANSQSAKFLNSSFDARSKQGRNKIIHAVNEFHQIWIQAPGQDSTDQDLSLISPHSVPR